MNNEEKIKLLNHRLEVIISRKNVALRTGVIRRIQREIRHLREQ